MTASRRPSCQRCGAVLASDQEYCLDCGTRRILLARSPWIAPLVAAAAVVAATATLFALAYRDMRDEANRDVAPTTERPALNGQASGDGKQGGGRSRTEPSND